MFARPGIGPFLALLCLATSGRAAIPQDVLILRNGEHRTGTLQSCVSDTCYLDGKPTAVPLIAWIGLAPPSPNPPALQNPAADQDEVHRRDGSVVLGHLVGISLGDVLLQEGNLERKSVEWIHLKGAPGEAPPRTIVKPPTEKPAPAGSRIKGGLWQGKVRARMTTNTDGATSQVTVQAQVRLREYRSPLRDHGKIVGTFIDLEHEGTEVREDFQSVIPGAGSSSGSGSHTLTTLPGDGHSHPSAIYLKSSATADTTPVVGFDVPFPGGRYFAGVTQGDDQYEVRGSFNGQAISELHRFLPVGFGRTPSGPHTNWVEDPQLRSLGADGVMAGSFNVRDPDGSGRLSVTWAICREDVQCIEPPDPGSEVP